MNPEQIRYAHELAEEIHCGVRDCSCPRSRTALFLKSLHPEHDGWISVADHLPAGLLTEVLVVQNHITLRAVWTGKQFVNPEFWGHELHQVTHWQPFPSPPEQKRHESL